MEQGKLQELLDSLTLSEKIGQLVQLSGDFFDETVNTTETGPSEKIGLAGDYQIGETGSTLNVLKPEVIRQLQETYLANSRHKIPLVFMADIIYGFNTIFPIPLAQACSWDFDLIQTSAAISAEEAYYAGQQVTFSPMVDLVRDPRWGRVMESPGEDPYIGKMFSQSVVNGFQGEKATTIEAKKLAACVKHYVAYGAAEAGRDYNGVDMSIQQLYSLYLPAFKAAIDSQVKLVMTAFNTLNGVPCTGNKWLNNDVLRQELGFDGVLITDYAANEELIAHGYAAGPAEAAQLALEATVDIDMKTSIYANNLADLVESGKVPIKLVDEAVMRVLELKNDLGLFENPYRGLTDTTTPTDQEKHREKALELAEKSVVLLKNNGILPLANQGKIALIGPYADNPNTLGMWAINGDTTQTITLKEGLEKVLNEAEIKVAEGAPLLEDMEKLGFSANLKPTTMAVEVDKEALLKEALAIAEEADTIIFAFGEHMLESGEAGSKTDLCFAEPQLALLEELSRLGKPLIGVVYSGRPNNLTGILDKFDGLFYAWYPGTMGGLAVANLIAGKTNPSGKLALSFPRTEGQIPIYYNSYRTGRPLQDENTHKRFTSRYLDSSNQPLFPFGYGLSYGEFTYHRLSQSAPSFKGEEELKITVVLENTSPYSGDEVIQLYIKDQVASISRPLRELKASQRVSLAGHEQKEVSFTLSKSDLAFFDQQGQSLVEAGVFDIFVGPNAAEAPLSLTVEYFI